MGGELEEVWHRREKALLALLAIPLLIALAALAYRSTLYVVINYNEGWNAFHATAAMSGGVLYPQPSALITNNYPPLSFYLAGSLAQLTGDAVFAGRLLSWAGFLGLSVLVWAVLRCARNDSPAALFGAMFFAAYSVVHFTDYVGMDDPQWLAHAIMMLGLFVYLRAPEQRAAAVAAGVLMAVALFVKHNIVALPVTFLLWLAVYDRGAALRFGAAGLATGLAGLALCAVLFGANFFHGLLAPRAYSRIDIFRYGLVHLSQMQIPITITLLGAITLRDRYFRLFIGYLAAAMIVGMIQLSGAGVGYNAMFEAVIALSLCLGHRAGRWRGHPFRVWTVAACAGALLLAVGLDGNRRIYLVRPWLQEEAARQVTTLRAVRLLAARPGRAVCETILLCYWAHKPFEYDPFNYNQGVRAGTKDLNAMLQRIESGAYSGVQIKPEHSLNSLPNNAREALLYRYRPGPYLGPNSPVGVLYFRQ
jgi:hypothetical protein